MGDIYSASVQSLSLAFTRGGKNQLKHGVRKTNKFRPNYGTRNAEHCHTFGVFACTRSPATMFDRIDILHVPGESLRQTSR